MSGGSANKNAESANLSISLRLFTDLYTNRHEEMSVSETTRDRVLEQHLGSETHESWPPTTRITSCKNNTVVGLLSYHTGGDKGGELLAIQEECQQR